MFEQRDFFEEQDDIQNGLTFAGRNIAAGQIGAWMLHIGKLMVILYTGYHGIHASIAYGGDGLGVFFQAAGIVVTELTLLGLYLAFIGSYINGGVQRWVAFTVYALGLTTVILTSIADSFLSAGYAMPNALVTYLQFGLPVSPILMLLGGFLVHYFEPKAVRGRQEAAQKEELAQTKFLTWLASQNAELTARKTVANAMLNAKTNAAAQIAAQFKGDDVQAAINATALANLPSLLSAIGIDPSVLDANGDGKVTANEVKAAGLPEPEPPTPPRELPSDVNQATFGQIPIGALFYTAAFPDGNYLQFQECTKLSDDTAIRLADKQTFIVGRDTRVLIPKDVDPPTPHVNGTADKEGFLA